MARETARIRAFTMPKWGIEMTEGLLAQWMAGEGDPVSKGQVLALVETDKITNEIEADFDTVLRRIVAKAGETYPVGALLGVFAPEEVSEAEVLSFIESFQPAQTDGEAPPAPAPAVPEAPAKPQVDIPSDLAISPRARELALAAGLDPAGIDGSGRGGRITFQDVEQATRPERPDRKGGPVSNAVTTEALDRFFASPLAKRIALINGVDLAGVTGTGPHGRIQQKDVLAVIEGRPAAPTAAAPAKHPARGEDVDVVRMSPMRKAIARRLTASKTTIPHFYLRARVVVDALDELRRRLSAECGEKISLNDMLIRACALALQSAPDVNVQVHGDDIHRFAHSDIAVAVATDRGLLTPVVHAAELKRPDEIARQVRELAARARSGQLRPEEFEGGSFSISNLGMYGVDQFDAVINQPQGAILAVGAARPELIAAEGGFRIASTLSLSLSCDHRAIDGAVGGRFLAELRGLIESPEALV